MGGATVALLSNQRSLPTQVKCIVEDCGFTSIHEEFTKQIKEQTGLPSFPFIPLASLICKIRLGFSLYEPSPIKSVAFSKVPILFIHGVEDSFVPTEMGKRMYNVCDGAGARKLYRYRS